MSRRFRYTFILLLAALGTFLAALSGWRYARASAPVSGPIVLISVESLRADRVSTYGYPHVTTPAIDRLAADGIVFERAYSHVPQTLPAHTSMFTGRLPLETGIRDAVGFSVPTSQRLLAEILRDRGFETGAVVSSMLLRKETGISQGFTFFEGDMPAGRAPDSLRRPALDAEHIAETWLDSVGTTRAFLFLHLDGFAETDSNDDAESSASYDAAIGRADEAVGQLIQYLKSHQVYDQSTVILVSDHGEGLGDHGEQGHGLFVYDEALRVPFIIKPPAGEGAGRRVRSIVQHVDLVPTILDLAKAPAPGNLRGQSLTPLFSNEGGSIGNEIAYAESLYGLYRFGWSGLATLTDGRYRYVSAPREELYDLVVDPRQSDNLAESLPDVAAEFRDHLAELVSESSVMRQPEAATDADRRMYAAFGYVGEPVEPLPPFTEFPDPKDKAEILERYRAGARYLLVRDHTSAIAEFQAITRAEPTLVNAWMALGDTATAASRYDAAVDAYHQAMQLAPNDFDAVLGAAAALVQLRRIDEAHALVQKVVTGETVDQRSLSVAHELNARIALLRHDVDLARAEATLAEKADSTLPIRAYIEGRIAFDRRRFVEAFESFDLALMQLAKTSGQPVANLRLYAAESLLHLERYAAAERLFLEELKDAPENTRVRTSLIAIYKATNRPAEAAVLAKR